MSVSGDDFGLVLAGLVLLGGMYSVSIFAPTHRTVRVAIEGQLKTEGLATSLTERQSELLQANRALADLASKDALTGLSNRRTFIAGIADSNGCIQSDGYIGYLDLDSFKQINDSHGHGAGDAVLIAVAERWRSSLPSGASLARVGGDEFVFYLLQASSVEASRVAERLASVLNEPIAIDGATVLVSCSIGMRAVKAGEGYEKAIARADAALYQMKSERKKARSLVQGQQDAVDMPVALQS